MSLSEAAVQKLGILSPKHLGDILKIPPGRLESVGAALSSQYSPFTHIKPPRPFQRTYSLKPRPIDNPLGEIKWIQKRIYRRLLKPLCFPEHVLGGVPKRSVLDNAERHLETNLLVTLDVRQCFPSITNCHVYRVWSGFLGCSPPVAALLTQLTTFRRHLPQGASTSPLLANLLIWMVDEPIRAGERARDLIARALSLLARNGLEVSRKKIRIMGPNTIKLLTGTRLGSSRVRAPKEKLSRIRSGIHKLREGLVQPEDSEKYVLGLVGQIRFVHQVCSKDAWAYAVSLEETCDGRWLDPPSRKFLASLARG